MNQRPVTVLAWSLLGTTILLVLIGVALLVLAWGAPEPTGQFGPQGPSLAVGLITVIIGTLVVLRVPSNPIGWLLLGLALFGFALQDPAGLYAVYALFERHGMLPGGEIAAWLVSWTWAPGALMLGLMFLLFPNGRLPSRRWRPVLVVLVAVWTLVLLVSLFRPGPVDTFREVDNPFGVGWITDPIEGIAFIAGFGSLAVASLSLIPRYRTAGIEERAQVRWVTAAGVLLGAALLTYVPIYLLFGTQGADPLIVNLSEIMVFLSLASVPFAVGLAILKYRLFDIDVVINKAVVFGVLAAFITGVYVALVIGVGTLAESSGNAVLSAVAAAVVALAFQPVRRWAQRLANRLVYGRRATPYEVLHEFSERVAGSYGTEDVLPRMAAILGEGTGAERAQVWLRLGRDLRPTSAWPDGIGRSRPAAISGAGLPELPGVSRAIAVLDRGELLGALSVTKAPSDPVTPAEDRLVGDLARQAGLVLRNARLVEDLRTSRARIVSAQDQERRRIERDIHDGAQQQLVALSVKAKLAGSMVGKDDPQARALLEEIAGDSRVSLESLRDLARGIYPPLLADKGLAVALEAHARKVALPVSIRSEPATGRYSTEVEATVYFCVLEALQNATKYSGATDVRVVLHPSADVLTFDVADNGRGFDPSSTPRGSGLQNMADRLEAAGGTFEIRSSPGTGTSLRGRIPVAHLDPA